MIKRIPSYLVPFSDDAIGITVKAKVVGVACIDERRRCLCTVEDPDVADPLFIIEATPCDGTIITTAGPLFFATDGDKYIEVRGDDKRFGIKSNPKIDAFMIGLTTADQHIFKLAIERFAKAL